MDSVSLKRRGY